MQADRQVPVKLGRTETALFALAALWYWSFVALFTSGGKNGFDSIPLPWLVILAFGPILSGVLAVAMHFALCRCDRGLRWHEILLVVFVVPPFLGAVLVWIGLLHYMG